MTPPLRDWFSARFDGDAIAIRIRLPDGTERNESLRWERVIRVCFKAGGPFESGVIHLFTGERPESHRIPTEADGGSELWGEILRRGLFDADTAMEAYAAPDELFCSPSGPSRAVTEPFPLYSPRQLPEIAGERLLLSWDQIGPETLLLHGDEVVWRERTGWEVYDRFEEIAVILKHRYGERLLDLVPTPGSLYALYGDSAAAYFHVTAARRSLTEPLPPPEPFHWLGLEEAVRKGDAGTLRRYLARGGDPNLSSVVRASTDTLLHVACWRRQPLLARMLVAAGADVNAMDALSKPPLVAALDTRFMPAARPPAGKFRVDPAALRLEQTTELVRLLAGAGANLSGLNVPFHRITGPNRSMYQPPLTLAARYGYTDALRFLIDRGADLEAEDVFGDTPLIDALRWGQAAPAVILIDAGADVRRLPYSPCGSGDTQLHLLIQSARFEPGEKPDLLRRMIGADADVNLPNAVGDSPLLTAVRYGTDHRYAILGVTDRAGETTWEVTKWPLWEQKIPREQLIEIVRLLRAAGSGVLARDRDGLTARDLALASGLEEVADLL